MFFTDVIAGGAISGKKHRGVVAKTGAWKLRIAKRTKLLRVMVLPKRWVVERNFAWIARNLQRVRARERHARTVVAFVRLAMIRRMHWRLTRPIPCS